MANDKIKNLLIKASDGKEISRRQLALRMKLPPQSINNWIDSDINPNDASLKKIAAFFNVRLSELMDDGINLPSLPSPTPAPTPDADYWKDKYITCMEELNELRKEIAEIKKEVKKEKPAPLGTVKNSLA